jgi:hypothetical protein
MTIEQISKKYNISTNFLNSKDDALTIIAESIVDLKNEIRMKTPNKSIEDKLDKLVEFCMDIKQSNY